MIKIDHKWWRRMPQLMEMNDDDDDDWKWNDDGD